MKLFLVMTQEDHLSHINIFEKIAIILIEVYYNLYYKTINKSQLFLSLNMFPVVSKGTKTVSMIHIINYDL